jgi:hypothetical protein
MEALMGGPYGWDWHGFSPDRFVIVFEMLTRARAIGLICVLFRFGYGQDQRIFASGQRTVT